MQITKINKKTYHLEIEGAIINISEGLFDHHFRKVTSIIIIPDDQIPGQPVWRLCGYSNNRILQLKNLKVR